MPVIRDGLIQQMMLLARLYILHDDRTGGVRFLFGATHDSVRLDARLTPVEATGDKPKNGSVFRRFRISQTSVTGSQPLSLRRVVNRAIEADRARLLRTEICTPLRCDLRATKVCGAPSNIICWRGHRDDRMAREGVENKEDAKFTSETAARTGKASSRIYQHHQSRTRPPDQ